MFIEFIYEVIILKKIMIIEDDLDLAKSLKEYLINQSFKVIYLDNLENYMEEIVEFKPNLILLDINLRNMNGFSICQKVRKQKKIPIVFVTGRDSDIDEIKGITAGGDDYIRKPFSKDVLLARINRILSYQSYEYINEMIICNVVLNISKNAVIHRETKEEVELSKNEFRILYYLGLHQNQVIDKNRLINYLWDNNLYIDENALYVNMSRLRKKLKSIGADDLITTVPSKGFSIC